MLSEISHTKKDRYRMVSLICGIYKTKQMNKHNKTNRDTDTENKEVVAGGRGGGGIGTNLQLQNNCHRDEIYCLGNAVNKNRISLYGDKW